MSAWFRDRVAAPVVICGAVIGFTGVGLFIAAKVGHGNISWILAAAITVAGLIIEFSGMALHDRRHLRRGEAPHAMWGTHDANRPSWLGGDRRPS